MEAGRDVCGQGGGHPARRCDQSLAREHIPGRSVRPLDGGDLSGNPVRALCRRHRRACGKRTGGEGTPRQDPSTLGRIRTEGERGEDASRLLLEGRSATPQPGRTPTGVRFPGLHVQTSVADAPKRQADVLGILAWDQQEERASDRRGVAEAGDHQVAGDDPARGGQGLGSADKGLDQLLRQIQSWRNGARDERVEH